MTSESTKPKEPTDETKDFPEESPAVRAVQDFLNAFISHDSRLMNNRSGLFSVGEYSVSFSSFSRIQISGKSGMLSINCDTPPNYEWKFTLNLGTSLDTKDPAIEAMIIQLLTKIAADFEESVYEKQRASEQKSVSLEEESAGKALKEKQKILDDLHRLLG